MLFFRARCQSAAWRGFWLGSTGSGASGSLVGTSARFPPAAKRRPADVLPAHRRSPWPPHGGKGQAYSRSVGSSVRTYAGDERSGLSRLSLGASALTGVLLWVGSRSAAEMEEGRPGEGELTAEETTAAVSERLIRFSPAAAATVLPWRCTRSEDGLRVCVRFDVRPQSDHFQTLMVSLFEMSAAVSSNDASQHAVNAVLSAWDDEADSTGIHVRLLRGDEEGERIKITLPWSDERMPSIELTSAEGHGFTKKQAFALARLIYMANAGPALGSGLDGLGGLHGILDLFTPPGSMLRLPPQQRERSTQAEGGGGGASDRGGGSAADRLVSMGARVFNCGESPSTGLPWDFLRGVDHIKEEVEDTVMLALTHPALYQEVLAGTRGAAGARTNRPRAVLFEGPPGCGKTSMALMMATRAEVAMVYLPLEAVVSKWYGEAEQKLAKVLELSEQMAAEQGSKGVLLFLDEIETVGMSRDGDTHEASRRLLSVLLRCVDGVQAKAGVMLVGATNRVQDIDAALRSRFDVAIPFDLPALETRACIVENFTRHLSQAQQVQLAKSMEGFSGRNVKEVCENTERRWAARIVRGKAAPKSLPPLRFVPLRP